MPKVDADHIAAAEGGFEPQRENNFQLQIEGLSPNFDVVMLSLRNLTLPGNKLDRVEIRYGNGVRFVSGTTALENVTLKVRDYLDKDVRKALLKWFWMVYNPQTEVKGLAKDYKKTGAITFFAPDGASEQRVADIHGAFPLGEPPTALTMDSQNPIDMDIEISVDKMLWNLE